MVELSRDTWTVVSKEPLDTEEIGDDPWLDYAEVFTGMFMQ